MKFTRTLLLIPSIFAAKLDPKCSCAVQDIFDKISGVSNDFSSMGYNMDLINGVMYKVDDKMPQFLEFLKSNGVEPDALFQLPAEVEAELLGVSVIFGNREKGFKVFSR